MNIRRFALALASALALSVFATGCASMRSVPNQVTVFSEWGSLEAAAPKSFQFVRSPAQQSSLEHKTYEQGVRTALAAKGFTEAAEVAQGAARYKIALNYSITEDKKHRELYAEGPGYGFGFGFGGSRWGMGMTRFVELPWYTRELRIDISDAASGAKKYETRVINDSNHNTLAPAISFMAEAALAEFPSPNGSVRVIRVTLPEGK